jgi:hypothetical protein
LKAEVAFEGGGPGNADRAPLGKTGIRERDKDNQSQPGRIMLTVHFFTPRSLFDLSAQPASFAQLVPHSLCG